MMQTEGLPPQIKLTRYCYQEKDSKDTEVQDGWKGHILPFELVQQT